MIRRIQQWPPAQRKLIFGVFIVAGVLLIVAVSAGLFLLSLDSGRDTSVALVGSVSVREFAVLPDDDAYPKTVAVGPDGMVYTGSFASGAMWAITPDGDLSEMPGTRAAIGAVSGLTVAPDGTIYVVDKVDPSPAALGGDVKRIAPDGSISHFASIDDDRGFVLPDDIALDPAGNVYVSDRGRGEIWRFTPEGQGSLWWTPPPNERSKRPAPTGLAYDPEHHALLVTDSTLDILYRVDIDSGTSDVLYDHQGKDFAPGFDGLTIAPDGTIYIAALAQNGVVRLNNGGLDYIAGVFRGISDIAYSAGRIYATNFDSYSLAVPFVRPRLPFALDVIDLNGN